MALVGWEGVRGGFVGSASGDRGQGLSTSRAAWEQLFPGVKYWAVVALALEL